MIALAAAVLFGATTPLVKAFGLHAGPFATAAVLYAGATLGAGLPRERDGEAGVRRVHAARVVIVALFGAVLGPASYAWGLQRAGALATSLLLNLEAIATVALARVLFGEAVGRRVAVASTLMVSGGALLALRSAGGGAGQALGLLAVVAATVLWALDNTLTRPLADLDPRAVVFWKALVGALLSGAAAVVAGDRWPAFGPLAGLLACGAAGYGLSLRFYLGAQRVLGAARTGSLFAFGPFVGAVIAFALGDRAGGALVAAASGCFVGAVWLHVTERHEHRHRHTALEHEHAHRHDDGHHNHTHDPPVAGSHSHRHAHEATEHDHPHGEDVHHRHGHDEPHPS
jgi:drug/metabolite transporter (DMT)-like permease